MGGENGGATLHVCIAYVLLGFQQGVRWVSSNSRTV